MKLGDTVRDTISGFEGVITSWTTWLNGCVRIGVSPKKLHDGKLIDAQSFDIEQIELVKAAKPAALRSTGGDRPAAQRAPDPGR